MVEFSLAEELRFLAAQCVAHAEGTHRDQDRQFIAALVMQLTVLGEDAGNAAALLKPAVNTCPADELPDLIRLVALALHQGARLAELGAERKAVAA